MCEKGFPFAGAHQQKHAQRQLLCCVIKQNLDNLLANLALLNLSCATHLIRIYRKLFCWCLDRNLCCRRLRAMRPRDVAHFLFGVVLLDVAHHGCIAFSLHPTIREKALQTRRICLRVVRWVGVLSWCCGCCSGHGRDGEKLCDWGKPAIGFEPENSRA